MKKVLFVANSKYVITHFRKELIDAISLRGNDVKLVCPTGNDIDGSEVQDVIRISLSRGGMNPITDFITFFSLARVMIKEKPDIVLNFTIKPVIYSSLAAAFFSKAKIFSNITGLGYIFTDDRFKTKVTRQLVRLLYRAALGFNTKVFFQNPDDEAMFLKLNIIDARRAMRINGSGINLDHFEPVFDATKKEKNSFLFVGRLLKDKGINELISAAEIIKRDYPSATVYIIGEGDKNPNSIGVTEIERLNRLGVVTFLGRVNDVRPFLQRCEVFVLPSYREGTPRAVLEAMASGMPIITTDSPGCRETVINGANGFLVPIKSSEELVEKMAYFIENRKEIEVMGRQSLAYVRSKFDVRLVNNEILSTLGLY